MKKNKDLIKNLLNSLRDMALLERHVDNSWSQLIPVILDQLSEKDIDQLERRFNALKVERDTIHRLKVERSYSTEIKIDIDDIPDNSNWINELTYVISKGEMYTVYRNDMNNLIVAFRTNTETGNPLRVLHREIYNEFLGADPSILQLEGGQVHYFRNLKDVDTFISNLGALSMYDNRFEYHANELKSISYEVQFDLNFLKERRQPIYDIDPIRSFKGTPLGLFSELKCKYNIVYTGKNTALLYTDKNIGTILNQFVRSSVGNDINELDMEKILTLFEVRFISSE